jgi:hypothetical protein
MGDLFEILKTQKDWDEFMERLGRAHDLEARHFRYLERESERLQLEEKQRQRDEEFARKRENQIAALPEKPRAFVEAGMTRGLTVGPSGQLGGAYRFVLVDHVDGNGFDKDQPRPVGLPWISTGYGLLMAMRKEKFPDDAKAVEVKCSNLLHVLDAVWPENLTADDYQAFDKFLDERRAHRLRKPDFFAPDLYDANREEPYLVDGMLPDEGISLFAGEWDSGKTILLVDLAAHIASGIPWLNRSVSPRPVIYYALEAGYDVSKRLCATAEKLNYGENAPTGSGPVPVRVEHIVPPDYDEWREQIEDLANEICNRVRQRCEDQGLEPPEDYLEVRPPVIIVDTLRQACGHKSRGPEVEEFFSKVDRLVQDDAASHVIIAHHTTKTGDEYAGDDFLASDSTSLYYVRRPSHDKPMFRLVCDRVKGIGKPPAMSLLFKVVDVGKQRTVILVGEANASPKLLKIAESLPARTQTDDLREALEQHLTGENKDARYKSYQRLRDKLLEVGLIAVEDGYYVRST